MAEVNIPTNAAIHGPYEDLAIAIIGMITQIIKDIPPEAKQQIWSQYIEDMKQWRQFWSSLKLDFSSK